MHIAGAPFTGNGSMMDTEELVREAGSVEDIKRAFGYTIINRTMQEQDKVAADMRASAMHDSGKGTELDVEA